MKPSIAVYIPVYGRSQQTIRFLENITIVYSSLFELSVYVLDCKGSASLKNYVLDTSACCKINILNCNKSDFWGACINKSVRHFLANNQQYFMLCNNDAYHFKAFSYCLAKALRDHPVVISNSIVVPLGLVKDLYSNCVQEFDHSLIEKFRADGLVAFDRNFCQFTFENVTIANVAPTVALAISREFLATVGNRALVPRLIPHYLSDYYFTHQLYKHGAVLSPVTDWAVIRFDNDYPAINHWSLFNPRSKLYIPAWITFLFQNSSAGSILQAIGRVIASKARKIIKKRPMH